MGAQHVTDADFETEVLKAAGPVLVDFWAEWCGPCRALTPTLDALAVEKTGKLKVVKVNVDESPHAPSKYGVRSIPALYIFKGGQVVAQTVGALPKSELSKWIDASI
ncbi:MAG: thioredoxin [Alphaproteobacteria bacterium]|nr:thioredoxin [Alphaproteobacteria bacterium]